MYSNSVLTHAPCPLFIIVEQASYSLRNYLLFVQNELNKDLSEPSSTARDAKAAATAAVNLCKKDIDVIVKRVQGLLEPKPTKKTRSSSGSSDYSTSKSKILITAPDIDVIIKLLDNMLTGKAGKHWLGAAQAVVDAELAGCALVTAGANNAYARELNFHVRSGNTPKTYVPVP